jgi:hypothetical protein
VGEEGMNGAVLAVRLDEVGSIDGLEAKSLCLGRLDRAEEAEADVRAVGQAVCELRGT